MQITLDPELRLRASRKAKRQGISFAEYVRRALESDLGNEDRKQDISAIFGLGASREPTDIARNKKAMIAEALAKKLQR